MQEVQMAKKCIYCKNSLNDDSVIDVCQRCGRGVWGDKMFSAIEQNMKNAKDSGNLYQGSVSTDSKTTKPYSKNTPNNFSSSSKNSVLKSMIAGTLDFAEAHPKEDPKFDNPATPLLNNNPPFQTRDLLNTDNEL
jgi:hypothetical protein